MKTHSALLSYVSPAPVARKVTMTVIPASPLYLVRSDDPQIKRLFGTDTLPTPFHHSMPIERVVAAIAGLNPEKTVRAA